MASSMTGMVTSGVDTGGSLLAQTHCPGEAAGLQALACILSSVFTKMFCGSMC